MEEVHEEQVEMLTDSEIAIRERTKELLKASVENISKMAEEVIVKAIAHEEMHSIRRRQKINLAGLANLLKILLAMRGVDEEQKKDIDLGEIPIEMDEAINYVVSQRAKGRLKSIQSNDLANLLSKRSEFVELKRLQDMVAQLESQQLSSNTNAGTIIPIRKREEMEDEPYI